ncbi:DUF423 domain-containing protein [Cecembia calidifontis]|jgi:uncharacterized membrane protein YgdD (TMEM256/DUF423 family)|uniref:Uncharacterized membrane protein YgdD (TMEM256/DUF423 family) n=1 Tax=Cecembia calidifontis TaxID=1187080 RepID=A0A4Q7PE89_9BACT|nr:DUF423 domain-containing protein [Cecembia calidifontis]RZS98098.1 uncharacterized membrane protein YgdD (TMEM256/DUF423 family) [Cecembia calidifontis]
MEKMAFIQVAGLLGALAVGIGAFGAHGLQGILESHGRIETFETGVKYHFYHALAMLVVGIWHSLQPERKWLKPAMWSFLIGILVFSGSLYVLSLSGITWLGAITPFGGVAFIMGWLLIILAAKNDKA